MKMSPFSRKHVLSSFALVVILVPVIATDAAFAQESDATQAASNAKAASGGSAQPIDPIGVWNWEQSFGGRSLPRRIQLKVVEGKLIGTYQSTMRGGRGGAQGAAAPAFGDPEPLKDVELKGDKLTFDVVRKFGPREFTEKFAGVIAGDEIAGMSVTSFGGRDRESAWMATRVVESENLPAASEVASETSSEGTASDETGKEEAAAGSSGIADSASPMRIPAPGAATDQPYSPRAILPGGIVVPLYAPNSTYLNQSRIKEPEKYNLSKSVHGRINSIVNIHNPSIEVHFASPSMNTGSTVILAAGGGHRTLNVGTESADFVPFFYNYGVNTVILRNRLRSDGYEPSVDAVRDALQAIRLVRKNAEQWKLDPNRIGIMGFSAGAELSAPAAVQFEKFDQENSKPDDPLAGVSSRPDFVGIIYPGPSPFTREPETAIPRNTPPAFITCAGAGDRIHAIWATDYFSAMLKASIPNVEMHIYGNGYHPGDRGSSGGLTHRKGIPFGKWHLRFIEWFDDLGFLAEPGEETKAATDSKNFVDQPPRRRRN